MRKLVSVLLTLAVVLGLTLVAAMPAIASSDMVSYWPLDDGSGTTAADLVDTNPGTLMNGPVWVQGQVNGALSFDGIDDYVLVPDSANLDITGAITVEAWLYPNTVSAADNWRAVVYKQRDSGPKGGYGLFVAENQSEVYFFTYGKGAAWVGPIPIILDDWNYVVGTFDVIDGPDNDEMSIYVNGELKESFVAEGYSPYATDTPLYIGGNPDDAISTFAPREFNGVIDEVAVYDSVLTAEQVLNRYYNSVVTLTAETPTITAINVDPTSIDFGTLYPGQSSSVTNLTISNVGTVDVSVATSIQEAGSFFTDNLWLGTYKAVNYSINPLTVGGSPATPGAQVVVPPTYPAVGSTTATLVFEATAV